MATTIVLEDDQAQRLLNVLEENRHATEVHSAVRWTPKAASRIGNIHEEVASQIE